MKTIHSNISCKKKRLPSLSDIRTGRLTSGVFTAVVYVLRRGVHQSDWRREKHRSSVSMQSNVRRSALAPAQGGDTRPEGQRFIGVIQKRTSLHRSSRVWCKKLCLQQQRQLNRSRFHKYNMHLVQHHQKHTNGEKQYVG